MWRKPLICMALKGQIKKTLLILWNLERGFFMCFSILIEPTLWTTLAPKSKQSSCSSCAIATLHSRASRKGLEEQCNLKCLSQDRRWFPAGIGEYTGQASPHILIQQILILGVAVENLSCCLPGWLAQNQTLPSLLVAVKHIWHVEHIILFSFLPSFLSG